MRHTHTHKHRHTHTHTDTTARQTHILFRLSDGQPPGAVAGLVTLIIGGSRRRTDDMKRTGHCPPCHAIDTISDTRSKQNRIDSRYDKDTCVCVCVCVCVRNVPPSLAWS